MASEFRVWGGTLFFGNGIGFGPAAKVAFEKGMWQVGPGVITLGAEMTFSYSAIISGKAGMSIG